MTEETADTLGNLDAVTDTLERQLDARHAAHEEALAASRSLARLARELTRTIHRGDDAGALEEELRTTARDLQRRLRDTHPELPHEEMLRSTDQEVAKALILTRIHRDDTLPTPDDVPTTPEGYLLGLGRLAGEIRHLAQDALRDDDLAGAQHRVDQLERLHQALLHLDPPGDLVDEAAQAASEALTRTRNEVTAAIQRVRLQDAIGDVGDLLDHLEQPSTEAEDHPTARDRTRGDDVDLDIDSVW